MRTRPICCCGVRRCNTAPYLRVVRMRIGVASASHREAGRLAIAGFVRPRPHRGPRGCRSAISWAPLLSRLWPRPTAPSCLASSASAFLCCEDSCHPWNAPPSGARPSLLVDHPPAIRKESVAGGSLMVPPAGPRDPTVARRRRQPRSIWRDLGRLHAIQTAPLCPLHGDR